MKSRRLANPSSCNVDGGDTFAFNRYAPEGFTFDGGGGSDTSTFATSGIDRFAAGGWTALPTGEPGTPVVPGVALGPVLGSLSLTLGERPIAGTDFALGMAAPGVFAAALCLVNMVFAWRYLTESRVPHPQHAERRKGASRSRRS